MFDEQEREEIATIMRGVLRSASRLRGKGRPKGAGRRWTRQAMIQALQAETRRLGKAPNSAYLHAGMMAHGGRLPSHTSILHEFGNLNSYFEAAGVERSGRKFGRGEVSRVKWQEQELTEERAGR